MPPNTLKLDFLGKDSIRYLQEHEVDPLVYNALQKFCKGKSPESDIFDQIDPGKVNKHLQSLMPGLTIKVFRTYNASYTLNKLLKETTPTETGRWRRRRRRTTWRTRRWRFCATTRRA